MNNWLVLFSVLLIVSCNSVKFSSNSAVEESDQLRNQLCLYSQNPDYLSYKGSKLFYYTEYGNSHTPFGVEFFTQATEVKNRRYVPIELYDFEFDKHQLFYNEQEQLLKNQRFKGIICGAEVLLADSLIISDEHFKRQIKRRDSLELNGKGQIDKVSRDVFKYDQWKIRRNMDIREYENLVDVLSVEQFLIRHDGKAALRTDSNGNGLYMYLYKKVDNEWQFAQKDTLRFVKF
nr:hypothetical protein [Nonlabens ulvanivorans]